jgi:pre-mRNA-splicing factor ATP-dependent RNA helicase DHX38/PRP16
MVCPVKDPTSVMAQIARKGSMLLRDVREKNDRDKSKAKFWELSGSKMGDAMGLKKKEKPKEAEEIMEEDDEGNMDYKASSQFSKHMQKKSVAASGAPTTPAGCLRRATV